MPFYNVSAIVLRRISCGETDRIVTLFSREKGKISGIAKGSRKPASRLAGPTETMICARFQLAKGTNLDVITQAEVKESFPQIHSDLMRLAYASYMIEAADGFALEDEVNEGLFRLLMSSLYMLERLVEPETAARVFDLRLMRELGYEPVLDRCLRCGRPLGTAKAGFSPSSGGMVCRDCGYLPNDAVPISDAALDAMRRLIDARPASVRDIALNRSVLDELARAMGRYIRFHSERDLKTMQFLQTIKLGRRNEESDSSGDI